MRPVFLDRWERAFPHARVVRFEDTGHFLPEEKPEEFCELVGDFLEGRRRS